MTICIIYIYISKLRSSGKNLQETPLFIAEQRIFHCRFSLPIHCALEEFVAAVPADGRAMAKRRGDESDVCPHEIPEIHIFGWS